MSPKTTRREFLKGTAILTGGALLAACAPKATPAPEEATAKPGEPTAKPEEATKAPEATKVPEPTTAPAEEAEFAEVPRDKTLILHGNLVGEGQIFSPFCIGGNYQAGLNILYEGFAYWGVFKDETTAWQAESWEYNDAYDELTIHFRPEITWSDGTPFTSEDVVYTLNHLMEVGSEVRHGAEVQRFTEEVTALDAHTVHIKMPFTYPRYFWLFFNWKWDSGAFPIMPKHIFEGKDWASFLYWDPEEHPEWPVTTGPMKVVHTSAQQLIMDRRDDWWAVNAGLTDPLEMERVVKVVGIGDDAAISELMVNAELDITQMAPGSIRVAIERSDKVKAHYGTNPPYGYTDWWCQALWVNVKEAPFDNADVRWGFSYLIDRDAIIEFGWEGLNTKNPMPYPPYPGLNRYTESISDLLEEWDTNAYDPERAAEHLTKAGYTKNDEGMWVDANGENLTFPVQSWSWWNAGVEAMVEIMKQNGIDASWSEPPNGWDLFIAGEHTVFPAGHTGSLKDPYAGLALYTCELLGGKGFTTNYSGWCNDEFDEIVGEMGATHPDDWDNMSRVFREAMEVWLPELPAIQVVNWMHNYAMNETYWVNWPTVDSEDGEYVNEAEQLLSFLMVMTHLKSAQ